MFLHALHHCVKNIEGRNLMDSDAILDLFNNYCIRGYDIGSEISRDSFSIVANCEFSEEEFNEIESIIIKNGLNLGNNRYYPYSKKFNESHNIQLQEYLQKICLKNIPKVDFLKVYDDLYDDLFINTGIDRDHCQAIASVLNHYSPGVYTFNSTSIIFTTDSKENEIVQVLKNVGYPITISEVKNLVETIAHSDVDDFFSRNYKKEGVIKIDAHLFTHIDCLNLDEKFYTALEKAIIDLNLNQEQVDFKKFYETVLCYLGDHGALSSDYQIDSPQLLANVTNYLHPDYLLKGGYIGRSDISVSLMDRVLSEFRVYDSFNTEIYNQIMSKYNRQQWVYLEVLLKEYVRISENDFISLSSVSFPIDQIDEVLSALTLPGYCSLSNISTFSDFPQLSISWNKYVLVSYLCSSSKKFKFDYNSESLPRNFVGIIHSKTDGMAFDDLCAKYLVDCGLKLEELDNEKIVGDSLKKSGFLTRIRKGRYLDRIISKAKSLRVEYDV